MALDFFQRFTIAGWLWSRTITHHRINEKASHLSIQRRLSGTNWWNGYRFWFTSIRKTKGSKFPEFACSNRERIRARRFLSNLRREGHHAFISCSENHSFVDGNKRKAAACFLKFLQVNQMLFNKKNELLIENGTLASLTLLFTSSKPEEMDTVKRLVISILNRNK